MNKATACKSSGASLPQACRTERFSWSRFAQGSMMGPYVPIPAHAFENQQACVAQSARQGKSSRRQEWRKSLSLQPSLFRCYRDSVSRSATNIPSLSSISSRSRHRFMWSQCPTRADKVSKAARQGRVLASHPQARESMQPCPARRASC